MSLHTKPRPARGLGAVRGSARGRGADAFTVHRTTDPAALLAAAQTYAGIGWRVFPCRAGSKEPASDLVRRGCLDATTDEQVIDMWWRLMPEANVAIATGSPAVDVVDVDHKDGRNGYEALGRLRRAGLLARPLAILRTPSGGAHLYYAGSEQGNGKLARHGIDFRSRGGYVLAPPSVVEGKRYEVLEHRCQGRTVDWQAIRRFLDPPRPAVNHGAHGTGDLDGLARWVEQQQPGNRNAALFWASCRAVDEEHADLAPLVTAAIAAGLPDMEAQRTVASALRRRWTG